MLNNIWSENKYVSIAVNCLLFMLAINIFHYGQFLLPVICLILFIDKKCKLVINNWLNFILLCLFAISFWWFSKDLGFYSTMGFCLPMAYFIGSNINNKSEESIKQIIYILAFGMATHVVLNFGYDIYRDGLIRLFSENGHMDFWLKEKALPTTTAVNYVFLISLTYYLIFKEKNKYFKVIGIVLTVIILVYDIGLGRRTPFLIFAISIIISIIIDSIFIKKNKKMLLPLLIIAIVVVFIIIVLSLNLFDIQNSRITIIRKFVSLGLKGERLEIFIGALKLMPDNLWGGQIISNILDNPVHDLWMDTFDYAGIIPFCLIIALTVLSLINIVKLNKNRKILNETKMFVDVLYICTILQMCAEPVMTGSSIFLICSVIFCSLVGKLNKI